MPTSELRSKAELNSKRLLDLRAGISTDPESEQRLKEALDTLAYPVRFFRDYDEPCEVFRLRLIAYVEQLIASGSHGLKRVLAEVIVLPIWPNIRPQRNQPRHRPRWAEL